jgi:hypothetical protein
MQVVAVQSIAYKRLMPFVTGKSKGLQIHQKVCLKALLQTMLMLRV